MRKLGFFERLESFQRLVDDAAFDIFGHAGAADVADGGNDVNQTHGPLEDLAFFEGRRRT